MAFIIGDKIIYEDDVSNCFKGEVIDIWQNDDEEITSYFVRTDNGLHIHFHANSLEWVRLDELADVSLEEFYST